MTGIDPQTTARGADVFEQLNPGLRDRLAERLDGRLPGFSDLLVEGMYGGIYGREGLDLKTRQLATIASLTALGGQTKPQLVAHVTGARLAGAAQREILEVMLQVSLYGGVPAAINAINTAIEVFETEEAEHV